MRLLDVETSHKVGAGGCWGPAFAKGGSGRLLEAAAPAPPRPARLDQPTLPLPLSSPKSYQVGILAAKLGFFPRETRPDPPSLVTTVWGRTFPNPLGAFAF